MILRTLFDHQCLMNPETSHILKIYQVDTHGVIANQIIYIRKGHHEWNKMLKTKEIIILNQIHWDFLHAF